MRQLHAAGEGEIPGGSEATCYDLCLAATRTTEASGAVAGENIPQRLKLGLELPLHGGQVW
jgi:hypothetical protein